MRFVCSARAGSGQTGSAQDSTRSRSCLRHRFDASGTKSDDTLGKSEEVTSTHKFEMAFAE